MLTQEYLKECLTYDPDTGIFRWKVRPLHHFKSQWSWKVWNKRYSGLITSNMDYKGYIYLVIKNKSYKAHRLAWLYVYGQMPLKNIDHINCNKSDNRIINLREASNLENKQNRVTPYKNNKSSGLLGVSKNRNKFVANIKHNNKSVYLGIFLTKDEAHAAYLKAKRELHPFGTI